MRCLAVLPNERSDKNLTEDRNQWFHRGVSLCKLQIRNTNVPFFGFFCQYFCFAVVHVISYAFQREVVCR